MSRVHLNGRTEEESIDLNDDNFERNFLSNETRSEKKPDHRNQSELDGAEL